ncbi:uncharacterized protein E5676_scaffold204G00680 [Cucumis melo var. makuwa]|uniref:Uncharacterized protein n=1 Tax=Cucumis melo var. makuwa TaxID=1194695 RepID=A0A5D3D5R7_CUCMM|nr:uncharacterized protein E5676_scaffold204G00680 [Cucumis melo var. makuwa]
MSRRGYANLAEDMDFGPANMWKKARTKIDEGYINEDAQQVANEIDEFLDKAPNEESPNDALTQALGTPKYGGQEKVLENVVKEKKGIAASVPPVSLTSKKKVVEEEEMKEEEVIVTRSMTKNKVKASRPMTNEVEVTSEPSNLPIQLKYILRYAERGLNDFPISEEFEKDQKNNILESGKVRTVECGYYVMRYMRKIVRTQALLLMRLIQETHTHSLNWMKYEWSG